LDFFRERVRIIAALLKEEFYRENISPRFFTLGKENPENSVQIFHICVFVLVQNISFGLENSKNENYLKNALPWKREKI
jgi:hypothetical protein